MPVTTKISRMVTYLNQLLYINLIDPLVMDLARSPDKLELLCLHYSTTTVSMSTKLVRLVSYLIVLASL